MGTPVAQLEHVKQHDVQLCFVHCDMFDLVFLPLSKAILHTLQEGQLTVKQAAVCRKSYLFASNSADSRIYFSLHEVVLIVWNMRSQF